MAKSIQKYVRMYECIDVSLYVRMYNVNMILEQQMDKCTYVCIYVCMYV